MQTTLRSCRFACALLACSLADAGHAASLLVNGSFELPTLSPGTWAVFETIPGWTTTFGPGIEIRNARAGSAQDGVNFVELDSNPLPGNSGMSQTFISPGSLLDIAYWYAARAGVPPSSNGIEIWLNSANIGPLFVPGDSGLGTLQTAWTRYTATVNGIVGTNTLEFRAVGRADKLGGSLDNVTVYAQPLAPIPAPLPAPLALMGAGLAALAAWRRRAASRPRIDHEA